jgi:hypothetical protein
MQPSTSQQSTSLRSGIETKVRCFVVLHCAFPFFGMCASQNTTLILCVCVLFVILPKVLPPCLRSSDSASIIDWSLMLKSAQRGDAQAQHNLGVMYMTRGEFKTAYEWFHAASVQNFGQAQYNLALMLENGHGCALDRCAAFAWYKKAASTGSEKACDALLRLMRSVEALCASILSSVTTARQRQEQVNATVAECRARLDKSLAKYHEEQQARKREIFGDQEVCDDLDCDMCGGGDDDDD